MKRLKLGVAALAMLLVPLCAAVLLRANAASAPAKPMAINGSIYRTGRNVTINGTINGDVYCAGDDVTINATVHGDVSCAGGTVTVNGKIDGEAHIVGQQVTVNAQTGEGLGVAAQKFTLASGAVVGQDASIVAGTAVMSGNVVRDVSLRATTATFEGRVGRNVRFNGAHLTFDGTAKVVGNMTYWSGDVAQIASGTVHGASTHYTTPAGHKRSRVPVILYTIVATALFGMLLAWLWPKLLHDVSERPVIHLGKTVLVGFLAMFALPLVIIALVMTVVGLPIAGILALTGLLVACLSVPVTSYYIGSMLLARSKNHYLIVALGTVLVVLACFLPAIGGIFLLGTYWIGSGALLMSLGSQIKHGRQHA